MTGVIKRLAELQLVNHRPYKGVTLTTAGEKIALEVIRHHRLIELYLIEALGYSWDEVHEEAERLEHVVSDLFEERIAEALGHPEFDPHGSPIPTKNGQIAPQTGLSLNELTAGQKGQVIRVNDEDPDLLRYLGRLGIRPGARIMILEIAPYGGSISVEIDNVFHDLGAEAAIHIFVELFSEE